MLADHWMQIVTRLGTIEEQQAAINQFVQRGFEFPLVRKRVQRRKCLVAHGTSKCREAAEQLALVFVHRIVGDLENVMLLLSLQLSRNRMACGHTDVSRVATVRDDYAGQEAECERMITIWLAFRLNLRPRAFHALRVEEVHSVVRLERDQVPSLAPGETIEFLGMQTTREQHTATHRSARNPL